MLFALVPTVITGLVVAVASGACFGSADFGAAQLGRKMSPFVVTSTLYLFEIPVLFIIVMLTGSWGKFSTNVLLFGIGILGVVAYVSLVNGLSRGHVSIIMSLMGLLSLVVPSIVSVVIGEDTRWFVWLGMVISCIAIICITQAPQPLEAEEQTGHARALRNAIIIGIVVGVIFGLYNTALGHIDTPIMSKVFILQSPGFLFSLAYVIVKKPDFTPMKKLFPFAALLSFGYNLGQVLFPIATSHISLMITNIIVNLNPAVTIGLEKYFVGEKTSRTQHLGFAIAVVGVILVSLGAGS